MTEKIREIFDQVDTDEDGFISKGEANFAIQLLGRRSEVPEEVFDEIDADHDGLINFEELMKLVEKAAEVKEEPLPIRKTSQFDRKSSQPGQPGTSPRKLSSFESEIPPQVLERRGSSQLSESPKRRLSDAKSPVVG